MSDFVDPNKVLQQLRLKSNMTAVDFGCGSGGWVIPLARILSKGKVIAVDLQEESLSALDAKARLSGTQDIQKIIANVEVKIPGIEDDSCDLVLISDLLFQVDDDKGVFKEAKRVLKSGGKVLVVEWKTESALGPRANKMSQQRVKEIADDVGLQFKEELLAGDYHYALVFTKA